MSNDKKKQHWIIGSKRFIAMVVTLAAFLVLIGLFVSGSDAVRTELVMLGAVILLTSQDFNTKKDLFSNTTQNNVNL